MISFSLRPTGSVVLDQEELFMDKGRCKLRSFILSFSVFGYLLFVVSFVQAFSTDELWDSSDVPSPQLYSDEFQKYTLKKIFEEFKLDQDTDKLLKELEEGASLGMSLLQKELVGIYFAPFGSIKRNPKRAVYWLNVLSAHGDLGALYNLGLAHFKGDGIEPNKEKGYKIIKELAKQEYPGAQYTLGIQKIIGKDYPQDVSRGIELLRAAAESGHTEAQHQLGIVYYNGKHIEKQFDQSAYWFHHASNGGSIPATYRLAVLYLRGKGVPKDGSKAEELLLKSAKEKYVLSQKLLANLYYSGDKELGISRDLLSFYYWLQQAANGGDPASQYQIGLINLRSVLGGLVFSDEELGMKWLQLAAQRGNTDAQDFLRSQKNKDAVMSENSAYSEVIKTKMQ